MPRMVQIRHVPDDVHRKLKVRAAQEGMTLSAYLLRELEQLARRPTHRELFERLAREEPVVLDPPPEEIIRELRGGWS